MKEVYVCYREWQGKRADINGNYVGDMVLLDNEDKAIAWLTEEVNTELEDAKEYDGTIVFDENNLCVKSGGSVDFEIARMRLRANRGVFVRVYDEYQDNYDSYSDIVIEIMNIE